MKFPVLVVLCVYQRGSLLDGLAMYLSCDTKKFHDNESTHVLHNFWTSTHRGEASPPSSRAAPLSGRKTTTQKSINQLELRYVMLSVCFYRTYLLTHVT